MLESGEADAGEELLRESIIQSAAGSAGFFRQQQQGEAELGTEEREGIVKQLLAGKPATFLDRFGRFLSEQQLEYFEQVKGSDQYEVEFYLQQARQQQCRLVLINITSNFTNRFLETEQTRD